VSKDAQPLDAARHGRVVDRPDGDAVVGEQQVACGFTVSPVPLRMERDVHCTTGKAAA
jgi:hypothetical protein